MILIPCPSFLYTAIASVPASSNSVDMFALDFQFTLVTLIEI